MSTRHLRVDGLLRPLREEHGLVLPLTLLALVILSTLAVALLAIGSSEVQISANHYRATQAYSLAEAGLEDAVGVFVTTPSLVAFAPAALTAVPALTGPGAALAAHGSYTVQYQGAGLNTVRVIARGTSLIGGATRTLTATVTTTFSSDDAIRTKRALVISGNPQIRGRCGSVHANGDLDVSGNPELTANLTASGTYRASGNPSVGGDQGGGRPVKPIPVIRPADFLAAAQARLPANEIFQMKSDGRVLDGSGHLLVSLFDGDEFRGFKYLAGSPPTWDASGASGHDGTYYFEGNLTIANNPGTAEIPWHTSLIATGDIVISGDPEITTHLTDTLFVAGRDIKVSGNPRRGFRGLFGAYEQIDISGSANVTGLLIAGDSSSVSETVSANSISGNATITYDCSLNAPIVGPPSILAWGP